MRTPWGLLVLLSFAGCYTGARATRDVNAAWVGHTRAEIEARWGRPNGGSGPAPDPHAGTAVVWRDTKSLARAHVDASLVRDSDGFDGHFESVAVVDTHDEYVVAYLDEGGVVTSVEGPSLRLGPPRGANLRWGVVLGAHVGMGRLDSTTTPLPGFGVYLGGMLSRTLALVGAYSFASGTDDDGSAIAMAGGVAAQWWPMTRLWLRAGPALLLSAEPEPADDGLDLGVTTGASFAVIRTRVFVLDLRLDLAAGPDVQLGTVGIGANLN